uniref:Uncharacterized protein n=1 Tax=Sinocyclocheilus anshuiensis TaxID=1608454 RepID=A0A671S452_9TELE
MSMSVPAFMQEVTGSVMSIYSSEFGNVEVKGTIQFAIHYVQKLGEFHVFVVQCKDLAVADVKRNRSDPAEIKVALRFVPQTSHSKMLTLCI